ncbi:hypothetical protein [Occallatibacter riparius]|uniref:Peptidase S8/S53 domain-containing protein n=1 Tax=Occallatibacter riparius TaxID=1002689 RepID=A0A9J7BW74_9BACT|nr:hypothetical protein [Occallatibacter riparius]UWZ85261.1 hypothetical protein MOP44_04795 [Occallatibacter riparius]
MPSLNDMWMFDRLCQLLYPRDCSEKRFTQDSPILAEVWMAFAEVKEFERVDILLNPDFKSGPGQLAAELRKRGLKTAEHQLAYNESHVVVRVQLEELLTAVLPLSDWWQRIAASIDGPQIVHDAVSGRTEQPNRQKRRKQPEAFSDLSYLAKVVREIMVMRKPTRGSKSRTILDPLIENWLSQALELRPPLLFQVSLNRRASPSIFRSRETIKADAATRVFGIKCDQIAWAVVDTGIDARHPAFLASNGSSRVARSFDFTRLRILLNAEDQSVDGVFSHLAPEKYQAIQVQVTQRLLAGLQIDWDLILPCLEIPHDFGPTQTTPTGSVVTKKSPTGAHRILRRQMTTALTLQGSWEQTGM